jgi:ATP-dependent protease ClpP protease subunit
MEQVIHIDGLIGIKKEGDKIIEGFTFEKLYDQIEPKTKTLIIPINTKGGDAEEGWRIHYGLKELEKKGIEIFTIALYECKSAGTIIHLAPKKENRFVIPSTVYMVHATWTPKGGNAMELREKAELMEQRTNELIGLYVTETSLTPEETFDMLYEETSLTANSCVELGFAVAILDNPYIQQPEEEETSFFPEVIEGLEEIFSSTKEKIHEILNEAYETNPTLTKLMQKNLGYYRKEMPQIDLEFLSMFLDSVKATYGMDSITEEKKPLEKIKPSQRDLEMQKVYEKIGFNSWKDRKYIVSQDGYLLDGHHDWGAGIMRFPSTQVFCYVIKVKARELIEFANNLKITYNQKTKTTVMALQKTPEEKKSFINQIASYVKNSFSKKVETHALEVGLADGSMINVETTDEMIKVGDKVSQDGKPLESKTYTLQDGTQIVVKDGVIVDPTQATETKDELDSLGLSVSLNEEDKKKIMSLYSQTKNEVSQL